MRLLKQNFSHLSVVVAAFLLPACGGDSPAETVPDPVVAATPALTTAPTPTPTPAPTPPTPTPTPTACISAPTPTTGYSLVFKGCSATNVAEYYDKTECVRDNATGLIWQGQNAAGAGIRANDQYKTNYDSTTALQKYDATVLGNYRAPTAAEINSPTNSIGFKNNVNSTNLCGSGAWRLPTLDELSGIVKAGGDPSIDLVWFPNTLDWFYWTSTPYAGFAYVAWNVNFYLGNDDIGVRGGPSANLSLVRLVHP